MNWLGVLVVSSLWGIISSQFFFRAWLGLASFLISLVGFVKGSVPRKANALGMGAGLAHMVVASIVLRGGYWFLTEVINFGYSDAENTSYLIFAVIGALYCLFQIPFRAQSLRNRKKQAGKPGTRRRYEMSQAEFVEFLRTGSYGIQVFDLIVNNFWVIAGAILIAIFGGCIARRNHQDQRLAAASQKFRSNLLQAFIGLYPSPEQWPDKPNNIDARLRSIFPALQSAIAPALQSAIAEFMPYVSWWRRRDFDQAWRRYHCSTGRKVDSQIYHHYLGFSGQPDPKVTFHSNVSKLLSFAKKT